MRRLRGGLGARMHVLDIECRDGRREKLVLRRPRAEHEHATAKNVTKEYDVLRLLESASVDAPRGVLLDAQGEFFGVPAMVLTYLPGASVYAPRDQKAWAERLARGLLAVHAITPDRFDLSRLHVQLIDGIREHLVRRAEPARAHSRLASEVHAVLTKELDRIAWPKPCLVHDDFWPGNTVWHRGRLAGIIDWTFAEVGDPRTDLAQCRADIEMIVSTQLASDFLAAYQRLAPRPLPDMWYFDLHRGLGALLAYKKWIGGYHDAGIEITPSQARRRIEAFLERALAERH
jgi:aminoglycoside phosphotransferase (APT) family kinase protein